MFLKIENLTCSAAGVSVKRINAGKDALGRLYSTYCRLVSRGVCIVCRTGPLLDRGAVYNKRDGVCPVVALFFADV